MLYVIYTTEFGPELDVHSSPEYAHAAIKKLKDLAAYRGVEFFIVSVCVANLVADPSVHVIRSL